MERTKQTKRKKDTKGGSENKKIKKEEKQKKLSFDPLEVRKYGRFKYYDLSFFFLIFDLSPFLIFISFYFL